MTQLNSNAMKEGKLMVMNTKRNDETKKIYINEITIHQAYQITGVIESTLFSKFDQLLFGGMDHRLLYHVDLN